MLPNIRATLERKFVANNFKKTPNLVTLFSTPWYTKASFVTIIVIWCCHLGGSFLDPLLTCGSRFDNTAVHGTCSDWLTLSKALTGIQ